MYISIHSFIQKGAHNKKICTSETMVFILERTKLFSLLAECCETLISSVKKIRLFFVFFLLF